MMNLNLIGKNALVCGSSQGMGKAIAIELADMGAGVTLFARNEATLNAVKSELATADGQQHHILVADFGDTAQVKEAIAAHLNEVPQFEILVNNTGGPALKVAHTAPSEDFIEVFNQHLVNNHNLSQAVIPGMKEAGYGRIINVISTAVKEPQQKLGASNAARSAVASWAKTMANELGQYNITVNNVLPGATKTARLESFIAGKAKESNLSVDEVTANVKSVIPMQRFGESSEFANAVAFLASPAAGYISGINLPVDGGRTASL